jgi:hypothetical protein
MFGKKLSKPFRMGFLSRCFATCRAFNEIVWTN